MTKEEFIQRYRASNRRENRRINLFALPACGVSVAGVIWGMPKLMRLEEKGYFDWATSITIFEAIGFVGLCLLGLALASRFVIPSGGGVHCPFCGEKIGGTGARLAMMTGNCGRCGEKIIDNPGLVKMPIKP